MSQESVLRYRFVEPLGRGGMGVVVKSWDRYLDRAVAVKLLRARPGATPVDDECIARFSRESSIGASLSHGGIVPIYEVGTTESGTRFFTMPVIQGDELKALIRRAHEPPRTPRQRRRVIQHIVEACDIVHYAHTQGVIHRDLKPSNIMVDEVGRVYVVDWGVARGLGEPEEQASPVERASHERSTETLVTEDGCALGTPSYMPPEQALGESVTPQADVYALGAVLYHALTNRMPYRDPTRPTTQGEILGKLIKGPPTDIWELAPDTPKALVQIVELAMAREPTGRYGSAAAMAGDLRAYLEGLPVAAARPSIWRRTKLMARRHRTVAGAVMGGAIVLGLLWLVLGTVLDNAQRRSATAQVRLARAIDREKESAILSSANALRASLDECIPLSKVHLTALRELKDRAKAVNERRRPYAEELETLKATSLPLDAAQRNWHNRADVEDARLESMYVSWVRTEYDKMHEEGVIDPRIEELFSKTPIERYEEGVVARAADLKAKRSVWRYALPRDGVRHRQLEGALRPDISKIMADIQLSIARINERKRAMPETSTSRWRTCRASIRSNTRYRGIEIPIQESLFPLGADPSSGLHEFVDVSTGSVPKRNEEGSLVLEDDTGIVFVLVPGAARTDVGVSRQIWESKLGSVSHVGPLRPVAIEPFFLAKGECTIAQWERMGGELGMRWEEMQEPRCGTNITKRFPMCHVSFNGIQRALETFGMRLPTAHEWEYAARAGMQSLYPGGESHHALKGAANVADQSFAECHKEESNRISESLANWNDGYGAESPGGSFLPNAFGLHDMIGNVEEWASAECTLFTWPSGSTDWSTLPKSWGVVRGSSWYYPPNHGYFAAQRIEPPNTYLMQLGFRAARSIDWK